MHILPTMNIIGCGKLGMTLGRLWNDCGAFTIGQVLNRSHHSAALATGFMHGGVPIAHLNALQPADVWLIGTPDDDIAAACESLAASGLLRHGDIVFHCSGALSSSALAAASACGALVASVHPIRSFADPAEVVQSFTGTYCGAEGDMVALELLNAAFTSIGAKIVHVDPEFKTLYHAAAVFASNYLVTVLDVAVQAYVKAGIAEETALQLMEPLVRGTVDGVFRLGTTQALTGPIARGDIATAVRQYRSVNAWDERHGELYKQLGKLTADIAARRRNKA
ncbi:oxidoreductase [Noviherbaspirillum sp. Root189]|nr:oxidoreductase [Noviherbaspirillum sp. Root189]